MSWDPDYPGAMAAALDPGFAATNLAIPTGSITAMFLLWTAVISALGGSTDAAGRRVGGARRQEEVADSWLSSLVSFIPEEPEDRTDISFTEAALMAVMDDTFTFAATTKQFIINTMGVSHFECFTLKARSLFVSKLHTDHMFPGAWRHSVCYFHVVPACLECIRGSNH